MSSSHAEADKGISLIGPTHHTGTRTANRVRIGKSAAAKHAFSAWNDALHFFSVRSGLVFSPTRGTKTRRSDGLIHLDLARRAEPIS